MGNNESRPIFRTHYSSISDFGPCFADLHVLDGHGTTRGSVLIFLVCDFSVSVGIKLFTGLDTKSRLRCDAMSRQNTKRGCSQDSIMGSS